MSRPTCKGCGAIIRWIRTTTGKAMPCDPERELFWLSSEANGPRVIVITEEGECVAGKQGSVLTPGARSVEGFVNHWGTCAKAKDFKR